MIITEFTVYLHTGKKTLGGFSTCLFAGLMDPDNLVSGSCGFSLHLLPGHLGITETFAYEGVPLWTCQNIF